MKVRRRDAQSLLGSAGRALWLPPPPACPSRPALAPIGSQAAVLAAWALLALLAGSAAAAAAQAAPEPAAAPKKQPDAAAAAALAADPLMSEAEEQYQEAVDIRCGWRLAKGWLLLPGLPGSRAARGGGTRRRPR